MLEPATYEAFSFGILSALSLPLGTLTTLYWKPSDRAIAFLMAFGGGALLAALTIDLVASTLAKGAFYPLASGCIVGGLIFIALNQVVNDFGGFVRKASTQFYHIRRLEHRRFRGILSALKRVDVFKQLPDEDFKFLEKAIYNWEVKQGTLIFSQGEPCDELYIIASGRVELLDPEERNPSLFLAKNDDLGWLAYVTGTPYRFSARAIENTSLWVLPKTAFNNLLSDSPELAAAVQRWLQNPKVINYLHRQHHLSNEAIDRWRHDASKQIRRKGYFYSAVHIEHNDEAFKKIVHSIGGFELFDGLPSNELEIIANHLVYKHYAKGNTFFHEGEAADHMFIIADGSVSIIDAKGRFSHSIDLIAQDAFGYNAFMTGSRYTMSAMAREPTTAWVLRRKDFNYLVRILPELARRFKAHLQSPEIQDYLVSRQNFSLDNAQLWCRDAIKSLNHGKDIKPIMAFHADISQHKGAPLAIWLGLMLDGIPEALVIGASLIHASLGFSLLAGLFLSNYPEALSSSVGMRRQGMKFSVILLMWSSLMLATGLLSALGNIYFAGFSHDVFAFTEGVAAGAMLTMIAQTMLPEAYFKGGEIIGFSTLLGFLAAIFFKTLE
ncbi:cyclic nucleotide-binding domain-containing protein [Methylomarinum sp. Ch1-1]|uniref:Cyclic nucleotide-binding domain-containing protein n=1 Tax=Methylomarinum roseum TaxID=3067653 RepID=A0AAU7NS99_9GAMM|nr:cyclic nucleotide-binding domain-containing protein [Methylomarinum sp. Ch1-1]MDP4520141.1 cyclic nucleotide-binding domain-containing protein [Methylomarinum sp. Ch1-1]